MLSEELLAILVCPACRTKVTLMYDRWLVCQNDACRRKYPIKEGIPIMLVEEGTKHIHVRVEDLAQREV